MADNKAYPWANTKDEWYDCKLISESANAEQMNR